ncbi:helix-turn-helix transcriptional regulator [Serratia aquatilis]|uniref:Response regulator transcription factor n=1 Tax=Serratia aquatilis TaxID=1737515 RepID=A0ABV6EIJ2_9GAMM
MRLHIVIALWDSNQFFIQGMQHILQTYFRSKGVHVIFMPFAREHVVDLNKADLIVEGAMTRDSIGYERHKIVIARSDMLWGGRRGEINFREKPEAVIRLLDELLSSAPTAPPHHNVRYPKISARERDVLLGIAAELTPYQIGKRLQISVKTVSRHKNTAMRKLGFKRTHDLYNWLLQGGIALGGERLGI